MPITEHIPRANRRGTSAPTADDDVTFGYSVGSLWLNTIDWFIYKCYDNTNGAAVWQRYPFSREKIYVAKLEVFENDGALCTLRFTAEGDRDEAGSYQMKMGDAPTHFKESYISFWADRAGDAFVQDEDGNSKKLLTIPVP